MSPFQLECFVGGRIGDSLLTFQLTLCVCTILYCLFVDVKYQLAGNDGHDNSYFGLCGRGLRCCSIFKFSIPFLMNFGRSCREMSGHFDNLCYCNRHTLQNGALSTLSNDSVLPVALLNLFDGVALASLTAATPFLLLLFDSHENLFLSSPMLLVVPQRRFH